MKVAIIARSTLYTVPGGDTIQAMETAAHLNSLGVSADIKLSNYEISYKDYDLLHFFNIIRPADILYHSKKARKPFVISPILVDYSEYDKNYRAGIGKLFSFLPADSLEYLKTIARWLLKGDHLSSPAYIWKGQRKSIADILKRTALILPNSESEYRRVVKAYPGVLKYRVIPNGINAALFKYKGGSQKDPKLVICVARIEGIKNQLNLIKALSNTDFQLLIIGKQSPNQPAYYQHIRSIAGPNVAFIEHLPQNELVQYYQKAKVHILPSWFETTGLSSIEAAAMGCNIVITNRGDAKEYFGRDAFYCDPLLPQSILEAVKKASAAPFNDRLREKILEKYTWAQTALQTFKAYQSVIT